MPREGHRQEREKKGGEYGPSCIKQSNKQTKPPKGFKKKHKFVALTPVPDPALRQFRHGGTKKRSSSGTVSPTAASARSPVLPSLARSSLSDSASLPPRASSSPPHSLLLHRLQRPRLQPPRDSSARTASSTNSS